MKIRLSLLLPTFMLAVLLVSGDGLAGPPVSDVTVVEEDWSLVLSQPSTVATSPQFSTCLPVSPQVYIVTTFNYREFPDFIPGGIQIQLWEDGACVDWVNVALGPLNVTGDTVRWTQVYRTNGRDLVAKIVGANAQSWGTNINSTDLTKLEANIPNFNAYTPTHSVAESDASFGSNHVSWFGVTEVRLLDDRGRKLVVDTTPRAVHSQ
jgi:hypothetical protein